MPPKPTAVASLTSTICPLDMRPPFASECMRVSSRSITRVFCVSGEVVWADSEYEGCLRGTKGRGGAGARGYLVSRSDEAGEVGDLIVAAVSGRWRSEVDTSAPLLELFASFLVLRRRPVSSL